MGSKIIAFWLMISCLALPVLVYGQADRFLTISNVKCRPLAMGGAFMSVEDDLAAIGYNPATVNLYGLEKAHRVTLFFNPVGLLFGGIKNQDIFTSRPLSFDDVLLSVSFLLKSVFVTVDAFEFGVLLGEETIGLPKDLINQRAFDAPGLQQNHKHSLVGRLRVADKISLGGSASLVYASTEDNSLESLKDFALSYGILLKPEENLNFGVSFVSLPDTLRQFRWPLERLVDESVNIGVSYKPFSQTLLSVDVRNLGEEQKQAVREFHFGFEQILFSQLALRAGFFNKKEQGEYVFTWGIGILDGNSLFSSENQFAHNNFLLNYSFIYENSDAASTRWHLLSFLLRI